MHFIRSRFLDTRALLSSPNECSPSNSLVENDTCRDYRYIWNISCAETNKSFKYCWFVLFFFCESVRIYIFHNCVPFFVVLYNFPEILPCCNCFRNCLKLFEVWFLGTKIWRWYEGVLPGLVERYGRQIRGDCTQVICPSWEDSPAWEAAGVSRRVVVKRACGHCRPPFSC